MEIDILYDKLTFQQGYSRESPCYDDVTDLTSRALSMVRELTAQLSLSVQIDQS